MGKAVRNPHVCEQVSLDYTSDRWEKQNRHFLLFFSISPPFVNSEPLLLLSKETEFYADVIEVLWQGSCGALHVSSASLQSRVDISLTVQSLIAENGLYSFSRYSKTDYIIN